MATPGETMRPIPSAKLGTYIAALHGLEQDNRLRGLKTRAGIDFVSNDYLALASAPRMKEAVSAALEAGTPIGAGGRGFCAATARSTNVSKRKPPGFSEQRRRSSLAAVMSQILQS
jgi:7-keto-8-aminopelargonate synthetase-like enzyme